MKIIHKIEDIRRNELQTTRRTVPLWELPLLQAIHGAEAVSEVGDEVVEMDPPAANTEFTRLSNRYKQMEEDDGSKGPFYVVAVYGQFGVGTQALARAIEASVAREAPRAAAHADLVGSQVSAGG